MQWPPLAQSYEMVPIIVQCVMHTCPPGIHLSASRPVLHPEQQPVMTGYVGTAVFFFFHFRTKAQILCKIA